MVAITVNNTTIENLISWTYTEDVTGRDPNAYTGGSGQVTASLLTTPYTDYFFSKALSLSCSKGTITGRVRSLNESVGVTNISADDMMLRLKAWVVARAQVNRTISQILTYLNGLAGSGITFTYGSGVSSRVTTMAGFEGSLYDNLKQFLTAKGLGMKASGANSVLIFDASVVDPFLLENVVAKSKTYDMQDASRKIEIGHFQHRPIVNTVIYPLDFLSTADAIQVEAGEIVEVSYDVDATLTTVNQPVCVLANTIIGKNPTQYNGTNGVYSIIGGDTGTDVSPAWWNEKGGKVEISINPDSTSITVKLIAPTDDLYAPYSISSDPDTNFTGMFLTGTGAYHKYEPVTITTGAEAAATSEDVGVTVNNIHVSNVSEAYNAGFFTAAAANYTLSRAVTTSSTMVPSFYTMPGKQIQFGDTKYRVESVQHDGTGSVSMDLSSDTRVSDFNVAFSGKTANQMTDVWFNKTALEVSLEPLRGV